MKKWVAIALLLLAAPPLAAAGPNYFLEGDACIHCHLLGENRGALNPALNWKSSVHFRPDSGCADCHGGLKSFYFGLERGHAGLPDKAGIAEMCGKCHQRELTDVQNRVQSEPGQHNCTVTCADCHGHHDVPPADSEFITAINCTLCHELTNEVLRQKKAVADARERIARVEEEIADFESKFLPAEAFKIDLARVKDDLARSFHLNPPETISESVAKALSPLDDLEASMDENSPFQWRLTGVFALAFLSIIFILLTSYQSTVISKEDQMVDKSDRGSGFFGPKWTIRLTLLIAVIALVLAVQMKISPTEKALKSINQTVTRTVAPELKRASDRATINSVYEMKRMMVTLDEIKENTRNAEIRSRIDQIKMDLEELSVKFMVHE